MEITHSIDHNEPQRDEYRLRSPFVTTKMSSHQMQEYVLGDSPFKVLDKTKIETKAVDKSIWA